MKRNHKLVIITVSLLAISGTLSAQSPSMKGFSADCIKYMSYYQEDYKAKKYDDALADLQRKLDAAPPKPDDKSKGQCFPEHVYPRNVDVHETV